MILGVLGTGVTFHLNSRLIADEGPTAAATVGYLLPVVSVVLGAVFLGERLGVRTVAGMAVVLVGVGLTRRRRPQGQPRRQPPGRQAESGPPDPAARSIRPDAHAEPKEATLLLQRSAICGRCR